MRDDFKDSEDSKKKNVDAVKEKGKNTPKLKENSNIEMLTFADDSTANYIGNSIDSIHVQILKLLDELRCFGLKPTQCFFILRRE